jgi:hypothetical protein
VGKERDFQVRAPLKQRGGREQDPARRADPERGDGVEREIEQLVARLGPDPDGLVELLAGRPAWERARAMEKLAADYGGDLAQAIGRAVDQGKIGDSPEPALAKLREEVKRHGAAAHGRLLVSTAERRAPSRKRDLSDPARPHAAADKKILDAAGKAGAGKEAAKGPEHAPAPAPTTTGRR